MSATVWWAKSLQINKSSLQSMNRLSGQTATLTPKVVEEGGSSISLSLSSYPCYEQLCQVPSHFSGSGFPVV